MPENQQFQPAWLNEAPVKHSFRSIFKYGASDGFKHPSQRFYEEIKNTLGLSDNDFEKPLSTGNELVDLNLPTKLNVKQIERFIELSGIENVSANEYERLKYSTGKTVEEALRLRAGQIVTLSELVVHPRNKEEIVDIMKYCNEQIIPIYVYGGGSSVNLGFLPEKGGITIVLSTHMNKIISLNELNQTVTVQPGMQGPAFENALNRSKQLYGTKHNYTCGHFPQSFEYSSVGGWFVTLGSGQQSSYYGDAGDLVLGVEFVTPSGTIITKNYPATATGPKILDIIKGSEGCFGIVTELTWRVFKFRPENRQYLSFIFPTWEKGVDACREMAQGEFGMPAVFRISDPEETRFGLKLYGIEGTILDKLMIMRGYRPDQRCLFIASADGEKSFAKNVKKKVKRIGKKYGGMYLTSLPAKKWEHGRYKDPYMREDLMDYGIIIDTLETSVMWDNLLKVHTDCREYVKIRPGTVCMAHSSHFYLHGTNLYFIFIIKEDQLNQYLKFQEGLIDVIEKSGGSLSHHHGVGRMMGRFMQQHLGENQMNVLKSLKKHFDPNNIMNPGKQLGLGD
jgi:alkyldihydroxyacetonephosphate synthase